MVASVRAESWLVFTLAAESARRAIAESLAGDDGRLPDAPLEPAFDAITQTKTSKATRAKATRPVEPVSFGIGSVTPQFGHVLASVETFFPHSRQGFSATRSRCAKERGQHQILRGRGAGFYDSMEATGEVEQCG